MDDGSGRGLKEGGREGGEKRGDDRKTSNFIR